MLPDDLEKYTRAYLSAVDKEWASISVGEKKFPLTHVFVMLQAVERDPRQQPEKRPDSLATQERKEHVGSVISVSPEAVSTAREAPSLPLSKVLAEARHLVLLGEAGAGKSTTLQFMGLCFAREGEAQAQLGLSESLVPVLLNLRTIVDIGPSLWLEQALAREVNRVLHLSEGVDPILMEWLTKGRLLVLLDGLDEVTDSRMRAEVSRHIRLFANSMSRNLEHEKKKCRIVLTSRPAGYISPASEFREYILKPFQHPTETRSFVQSVMRVVKPNLDERQVLEMGDQLLESISHQPALARITNNPLFLRLAVEEYQPDEPPAHSREALCEKYIGKTVWERRDTLRSLSLAERNAAQASLETLAWQLQTGQTPTGDEDLALLCEKLGLVVQHEGKLFFNPKTFQEYFVARRLAKAWQKEESRQQAWAVLRPRLHDPEWREPLLLLVGSLDVREAAQLIKRVLNAHSRYESALFRDLRLAAEMAGERTDLPEKILRQMIGRLKGKLTSISNGWWQKHRAAEALARIGVPALPALLQAYQDWWVRLVAKRIGLDYDSDRPLLLRLLRDKAKDTRNSIRIELSAIGTHAIPDLLRLIHQRDVELRLLAVEALGEIGDARAVPELLQALQDPALHEAVIRALGQIGDQRAVPDLLEILDQSESQAREATVVALGAIGNPSAISALARETHGTYSQAAIKSLVRIGTPAIPALYQIMEQYPFGSTIIGTDIERILGEFGDVWIVPRLVKNLWVSVEGVGLVHEGLFKVFKTLIGRVGGSAVPVLLPMLQDQDTGVRVGTALALGEIGDRGAIPDLHQLLNDPERIVRSMTVVALGKIGDACSVLPIMRATRKWEHAQWWDAEEAVLKIGAAAVPVLIDALQSPDTADRRDAAHWLGRLGAPGAVEALCRVLHDKDLEVCKTVAEALDKIGDAGAVPSLLKILETIVSAQVTLARQSGEIEDDFLSALMDLELDVSQSVREALGDDAARPNPFEWQPEDEWLQLAIEADRPKRFYQLQDVNNAAITALGEIGDRRAVVVLCVYLDSPYWHTQIPAAEALGRIGDPRAIPSLHMALQHWNDSVRRDAAKALGKLKDVESVPDLIKAVQDPSKDVRKAAVEALGAIGDKQAIPVLQQALEEYHTREAAIYALASVGTPQAFDILIKTVDFDNDYYLTRIVRRTGVSAIPLLLRICRGQGIWKSLYEDAVEAIKNLDQPAIDTLQHSLQDPDAKIRRIAVEILSEFGPTAFDALQAAMGNQDLFVRKSAAMALAKLNDPRTIPGFRKALLDEDHEIRLAAAVALGKMGQKEAVPIVLGESDYWNRLGWDARKSIYEILGNLGDAEVIRRLHVNGDPDSMEVREKIGNRIDDMQALHTIARVFRLWHEWWRLDTITDRIDALSARQQARQNPIVDPLSPPASMPARRRLQLFAFGAMWVVLTVLLGGALLFYGVVSGLLAEQWKIALKPWAMANPLALIGIAAAAILLGGLMAWLVEWLKKSLNHP